MGAVPLFTNPELAQRWWNADHLLINVQDIPDEELKQKNLLIGILEYFLKYIHKRNLCEEWEEFAPLLSRIAAIDFGTDYIELILTFTLTKIDKNDSIKLQKLLTENLTQEQGTKVMASLAYHWMEQGIEKGIEKGILKGKAEGVKQVALNMLRQNLEIKLIQQVTGLSLEDVLKLKAYA